MLEKLKQQNVVVRILIFYGLQFIYFNIRLSMNTGNRLISHYQIFFIIFDIITFLLFAVYIIRTFRLPVKSKFFSGKTFGWLLLGLMILLIYGNLEPLFRQYFPPDMNGRGVNDFSVHFPVLAFFFSSIMAPVMEESIFRGVFFQLFFQKITKWRPFLLILISGLIFGSIHVQAGGFAWQNLLIYSFAGMIFGTVYYFNKDLKVNILLHFANNVLVQFAPFIFTILWNFFNF